MKQAIFTLLLALGVANATYASNTPPPRIGQLVPLDVQALRLTAAPGEKITPLRVIRWVSSVVNETPMDMRPVPVEFVPTVTAHNSDLRIIAALAYKF